MESIGRKRYNEEFQAVRAIAIGLVLVSHIVSLFPWNSAEWVRLGRGFYVGVDLFLCLSGYVITKGLARELANAQGDSFWRQTAAFWVRRLYRITPSAWLWLAIPMICYSLAARSISGNDLTDIVAAVTHVENIRSWQCAWTSRGNCGSFGHYWSLSLEEQFYLLLPLLFFAFRRRLPVVLVLIVVVQVLVPRPLGVFWGAIKTDALMLGVLLALWSEKESYRIFDPNLKGSKFRFVIPFLLVFCLVGMTRYEVVPIYIGMAAVISAVIVWICSYDKGYFIGDNWLRSMLVWIGERSFAIYLIHPFSFWATRTTMAALYPGVQFDGTYTLRFAAVGLAITMALWNAAIDS